MTKRHGVSTCAGRAGRAVRGAIVSLVAAWLVAVVGSPAFAHAALEGTSPASGERLTAPPGAVTLRFTEDVLKIGLAVQVTGPNGVVNAGRAAVDGDLVTQPLASGSPPGIYSVRWRVTSDDGHPISGSFAFIVVPPSASATAPTASVSSPAVGVAPTTTPPIGAAGSNTADAAARTSSGWGVALGLGGAVAVLLLFGLAAVLLTRRRPRRSGGSPGGASAVGDSRS